jgi:hypothetical protein
MSGYQFRRKELEANKTCSENSFCFGRQVQIAYISALQIPGTAASGWQKSDAGGGVWKGASVHTVERGGGGSTQSTASPAPSLLIPAIN